MLRWRSALERTGQDGPRGNENDGRGGNETDRMDKWTDGRTDGAGTESEESAREFVCFSAAVSIQCHLDINVHRVNYP